MKETRVKIVSDGPQRYREARDYDSIRRRMMLEAELRYEGLMRGASIWRRIWIAVAIRCEVRAKLKEMFPPGSLHLAAR